MEDGDWEVRLAQAWAGFDDVDPAEFPSLIDAALIGAPPATSDHPLASSLRNREAVEPD
jgi:hypothetical protein